MSGNGTRISIVEDDRAIAAELKLLLEQWGYEDQRRFAIMRKLGMTRELIRRSVNAQMLTVFLLPVAFAVLHLCFAFPMVEKVLMIFGVVNRRLFLITNLIGALAVTLFYMLIYRITGNAYYRIVSGANENL